MTVRSQFRLSVFKSIASKLSALPSIPILLLTQGLEATISFYCTLYVFVDD